MGFSGDNGSAPARFADVRTAFAAVLGLSCMFGGIWLSDGQLLGTGGSEVGTLAMRVCTCAVYFAFFLIARRFSRRGDGDVRWLFGVASTVGIALFATGALCILLVLPGLEHGGAAWMAVGVSSLFMVKTIGAPVSVGLVCLFARLDGAMVVRSCTLGMLGAFALYSLVSRIALPRRWAVTASSALPVRCFASRCCSPCSASAARLSDAGPAGARRFWPRYPCPAW